MSLRTKKILLGTWPLIFSGCYICGPLYVESSGEMQQEEDMKAAQEDMSSPGTEADKGMLIEDQGSISPDMSVDLTDLDMFIAQDSMPDIVEAVDMADMMQTPPPAGTCTFPGANSAGGRLAAFPGAEGFGRYATGGRGGRVLKVTNTNDSGPGSLRWALEDETGPRIVIFEVEGMLSAKDEIQIKSGDVTIAGQTAPGDGFTMRGARIQVAASNVIVRGMRIRPGDGAGDIPRARDGISLGNKDRLISDIVIDHNSLTWAVDETLTAWYEVQDATFSYNILAEPLYDSIHVDEGKTETAPHGMGILVGEDVSNLSILSNVLSHCNGRNPLTRGVGIEFSNNYVYNYGNSATLLAGNPPTTTHVVSNYYVKGPQSTGRAPVDISEATFETYVAGNLASPERENLNLPEANVVEQGSYSTAPVFMESIHHIRSAEGLFEHLSANVGARAPALDAIDARIVRDVSARTGKRIDSQGEVGGYLPVASPSTPPPADSDQDGVPDDFEALIGSNPMVDDAMADQNNNGYANIEEYVNSLIPCPHEVVPVDERLVEAESMQLSNYDVFADDAASGGAWVQTQGTGTATMTFRGAAGMYRLTVYYFDENDGSATMTVSRNQDVLDMWTWDKDLGSALAGAMTRTEHVIRPVSLQPGDQLSFLGVSDSEERARFDSVMIEPLNP